MYRALLMGACAALFLFAGTAFAVDKNQELAVCAAKGNSVDRLQCYDDLSSKRSISKTAESFGSRGNWFTDQSSPNEPVSVIMTLNAATPVYNDRAQKYQPVLVIRCMNNVTSSYVDLENSLGSGDIKVTYRIDNGKSVTEIWGISNRHDSVGRWNSGDSIPFIKGLLKKNSIFFEIAPYISTRFDVKGLEEAVKPLRKACGW